MSKRAYPSKTASKPTSVNKKSTDALAWAHPLVREWFINKFETPTTPQVLGWPSIIKHVSTLISAPTGSGKTLTAFLVCINDLVKKAIEGKLPAYPEVVYISPLKALSNDIYNNLTQPLQEIQALAEARGYKMDEIRVMVRTGDTLAKDRQQMLRKPPHILVTTPESFYILLTAEKSRALLQNIKTVIVDEIHALINNKRGSHLALSLERLEHLSCEKLIRIGLSATQRPLNLVGHFLMGSNRKEPIIVDVGNKRTLDLQLEVPTIQLGPVASNEMWDEIYDRIVELINQNRTTLVFVNTRRLSERVAHHLRERLGEKWVEAHHGSLSRKIRLATEHRLKNGELKAVVATASLELGIDIGSIDLVCQLGSPRSINIALQRLGRSGHWVGATPKAAFFATTRDELIEWAALIQAIKTQELDELLIPKMPLDILMQQIIACSATQDWTEKELFELIKKAYPYKDLTPSEFNEIIEILSEGIAASRGKMSAYLYHDKVNSLIKGRRGNRLLSITNGGAIPDNGLFTVFSESDEIIVGTLDEDFAIESNRGDVILLGNTSWLVKRVEATRGRVVVENAKGAPPSVPFWLGEAPGRTKELSWQVSELRKKLAVDLPLKRLSLEQLKNLKQNPDITEDEKIKFQVVIDWLIQQCHVSLYGALQLIHYILEGRAVLGQVPSQDSIIAERFFDESGGMQLIIHAPFGARINKAWGLALRKKFCRSFNFELQAAATDNGLNISLAEQHSFPLSDVFQFLHSNSVQEVLTQTVLQAPLFTTRWRWVAGRALSLVRFRRGKKVPPNIQRMLAQDLLAAVFPNAAACQDNIAGEYIDIPNHPLVNETLKDVLTEALDIEGLTSLLKKIENKEINCIAVDTPVPSVFSNEILNANPYAFLDDAPLEERRARAVDLRRVLPDTLQKEIGALDSEVISELQQQIWPDLRSADELQDLLQTCVVFPENAVLDKNRTVYASWRDYIDSLISEGRVSIATVLDNNSHQLKHYWVSAEKRKAFRLIYPNANFIYPTKTLDETITTSEEALELAIKGWMLFLGPSTASELSLMMSLPESTILPSLIKLETTGYLLRGNFRNQNLNEIEWCERRLLARIHRLTINKLRKEIDPVSSNEFMMWLLKWQHVLPSHQLSGKSGIIEIIRQLQGFEIPAKAWEKWIFPKRLKDYDKTTLDYLCLTGVIGFGRFSPHPGMKNLNLMKNEEPSKLLLTSNAPITFFVREESRWLFEEKYSEQGRLTQLSQNAISIYHYLKSHGASFITDIMSGIQKPLRTEVEMGLWELVIAGLITADSFDNLRALIEKRRRLKRRRSYSYFSEPYNAGRWSLLKYIKDLELDRVQHLEAIAWVLLKRYGVVFRDLLQREKNIPRWSELLNIYRRLEERGAIRGGRFVSGFSGEQFALSIAVDSLRAFKNEKNQMESFNYSASDPLNLVGILSSDPKIPASSKRIILVKEGGFGEELKNEKIFDNLSGRF